MTNKKYEEFDEFRSKFLLAEQKIKQIELISGKVAIPSINQLRYAACHLARYLGGYEPEGISDAVKHCKRAIYDALELGIYFYLDQIDSFHKDYKLVKITKVLPDYVEDKKNINIIRSELSVQYRHKVENAWEKTQKQFDVLENIYQKFDASRDELNKEFWLWRTGIIITLLGVFIAIIRLYQC